MPKCRTFCARPDRITRIPRLFFVNVMVVVIVLTCWLFTSGLAARARWEGLFRVHRLGDFAFFCDRREGLFRGHRRKGEGLVATAARALCEHTSVGVVVGVLGEKLLVLWGDVQAHSLRRFMERDN